MEAWIEVGVFGAAGEDAAELSVPLDVQQHRVCSGAQTTTLVVPHRPVLAGIGPNHLLDREEREDDDNIDNLRIDG